MSGKPRLTAKQIKAIKSKFCEILERSPAIEVACQKVGRSRMTINRWRKTDPAFNAEVEEALSVSREAINDLAENQLIKAISNGHIGASKYWLSNNSDRYKKKTPSPMNLETPQSIKDSLDWDLFEAFHMTIPDIINQSNHEKKDTTKNPS